MTEAELTQVFVILDQVWGGLDEDKEGGYRYVLARYPADLVLAVVDEMTQEDRTFLPRPPEIAARVRPRHRRREYMQRAESNLRLLTTGEHRQLNSGEAV